MARYPLAWPANWRRTPRAARRRANFARTLKAFDHEAGRAVPRGRKPLTVYDAIQRLTGELGRLGARSEILSTNVQTRLDGLPRSNQPEPADVGAAVYFTLKGQDRCLACDRWDRVADNIAALAQHIDALRRIERYGVGTIEQAFAGYAALAESTSDWRNVLGLNGDRITAEQIEARYRELARTRHPDVGGDGGLMSELNMARVAALREVDAAAAVR